MASITHTGGLNSTAATETSPAEGRPVPVRRFPPLPIADSGKVRLGAQGPCFRAAIADSGRVRLGAQAPLFR
jgi:hypothetical protein